jgi:hypothetical protein
MTSMLEFFNWLRGKKKGNKMIVQYVRDLNRNPVGVVVAIGPDQVGWSVCHPKDRFDKVRGLNIAIGRAQAGKEGPIPSRKLGDILEEVASDSELLSVSGKVDLRDELEFTINRVVSRSLRAF